jgi:TolB-like protein/DNA-binding winged helix-turn-helix (wHTH) protein
VGIRIGDWEVDADRGTLTRGDASTHLRPRAVEVLVYLIEQCPRVVGTEELVEQFWAPAVVGDDAIQAVVAELRKALGDDARNPRYIRTVPKRGYQVVEEAIPASAGELETAARGRGKVWLGTGAVLSVALAAVVLFGSSGLPGVSDVEPSARVESRQAKEIVAVLPFENLSGAQENDYFAAGVHEDVLHTLGEGASFDVIGLGSVTNVDQSEKLLETARSLAATHVLTGSVRRDGGVVRIGVQLVDPHSGRQLWSERYDRDIEDVFTVQMEIAERVADELHQAIAIDEVRGRNVDPRAYDLFLQARLLTRRANTQDNGRALELLDQALDISPDFVDAYAQKVLVVTYPYLSVRTNDDLKIAASSARRALALDENSWFANMAMAKYLRFREQMHGSRDGLAEIRRYIDRSLRLNGADSSVRLMSIGFHMITGDLESMFAEARENLRLDPLSAEANITAGDALELQGDWVTAREHYERAVALEPEFEQARTELFSHYHRAGDHFKAYEYAYQALRQDQSNTRMRRTVIGSLAGLGLHSAARRWFELEPPIDEPFAERLESSLDPNARAGFRTLSVAEREARAQKLRESLAYLRDEDGGYEWRFAIAPRWPVTALLYTLHSLGEQREAEAIARGELRNYEKHRHLVTTGTSLNAAVAHAVLGNHAKALDMLREFETGATLAWQGAATRLDQFGFVEDRYEQFDGLAEHPEVRGVVRRINERKETIARRIENELPGLIQARI